LPDRMRAMLRLYSRAECQYGTISRTPRIVGKAPQLDCEHASTVWPTQSRPATKNADAAGKPVVTVSMRKTASSRAAVLRDISTPSGSGQLGAIQSATAQLGMEFRPVGVRDAGEIERGITDFARGSAA
jgi:hypothetical protein